MSIASPERIHDRGLQLHGNGAGPGEPRRLDRDLVLYFRQRFEKASKIQEKLAEEREKLLLERDNVRSAGKKVRIRRVQTGDAEAAFMSVLREFINRHGDLFTSELNAAYRKVEQERDILGSMEEDYLQAERSLGGSEWTFIDKENDFYQYEIQDLFSDGFLNRYTLNKDTEPPPQPSRPDLLPSSALIRMEYQATLAKLDQLKRQFNALRPEQAKFIEEQKARKRHRSGDLSGAPETSEFVTRYSALLTEIAECEVKIQQFKQDLMQREALDSVMTRRNSDPAHFEVRKVVSFDTITRAQTDGVVPTLLENPAIKHRIRDWILERLKTNPVERTTYLNILAQFHVPYSDHESWEDRATQYWPHDMSEESHQSPQEIHSITHQTSKSLNPNTLSNSPGQHQTDDIWSMAPKTKIGLDFDANFNYAPLPALESDDKRLERPWTEEVCQAIAPEFPPIESPKSTSSKPSDIPILRVTPTSIQDLPSRPGADSYPSSFLEQDDNVRIVGPDTETYLEPRFSLRHDSAQASVVSENEAIASNATHQLSTPELEIIQGPVEPEQSFAATDDADLDKSPPDLRSLECQNPKVNTNIRENPSGMSGCDNNLPQFELTPPHSIPGFGLNSQTQLLPNALDGITITGEDTTSPLNLSSYHTFSNTPSLARSRPVSEHSSQRSIPHCPFLPRRCKSISSITSFFSGKEWPSSNKKVVTASRNSKMHFEISDFPIRFISRRMLIKSYPSSNIPMLQDTSNNQISQAHSKVCFKSPPHLRMQVPSSVAIIGLPSP